MQQTLKKTISLHGTGLHSGAEVTLVLKPSLPDTGIVFVRTDVADRNNVIPARWDHVVDTRLCTVIGNIADVTVSTIEHLMAALAGCGVDNVVIEIDGPEVPIMDGSSEPFVTAIDAVGVVRQITPRRAIKVLKSVSVEENGKVVTLSPDESSRFVGRIDFAHPSIGTQERAITLMNGNFRHDIADSRTFGFIHEVEALSKVGLALGGSLENAIVLDQDKILNPEGLRHADEFIRHKLLDAIGDLYLAGPILGVYEGYKGGHALNNQILRKLFATDGAWEMVAVSEPAAQPVTAAAAVITA